MSLLINPFTYSANQFSQAVLAPTKTSRLFSPIVTEGGAIAIYGDRGMGKTLTLNYKTIFLPFSTVRMQSFHKASITSGCRQLSNSIVS
jgi:hypothetical protein